MTAGQRLVLWIVAGMARQGRLDVTLPDGMEVSVGEGVPQATLVVRDAAAVRRLMRAGLTGFAEAHMDDRLDTPDLVQLLRWGAANQQAWFRHPIARVLRAVQRLAQRVGPRRRHPRVRTMNDHYNLGNDFYSAWLDETMTYSSARFAHPDDGLAHAQRHKYRTIADHAGLRPGMRVLEIGCGWGGFAEYAARERGCEVLAITLAEEHAAHARKRIADGGLDDRVQVDVRDFREVRGTFDAVVSIEMIESVDESQWPSLVRAVADRLAPDGRAVLQVITIADDAWEQYRTRVDFIQQYIFPGGQVPAPKVLRRLAREARLSVEQVETFGLDYARTLEAWRERFDASWPALQQAHGLDERFRRMWRLYLALCETGFRMGRTNVEQWVVAHAARAEDPRLVPGRRAGHR